MTIAEAGNTGIPASLVLEQKGFLVRREVSKDGGEHWIAERSDFTCIASGAEALLGLVSVFEVRGEDWFASDEEIDSFLQRHRLE